MKTFFLQASLLFVSIHLHAQTPCSSSGLLPNLQNGLVAYYPFCNSANDESGNNYNGVVYGATLDSDRFGTLNSAYSFDGISNYIELGDAFDLLPRSIAFWFNTSVADFSSRFVYCSDNPGLVNGLTNFGVVINNNADTWWSTVSNVNRFSAVTQNTWHHAVIVVDSNMTYKYFDGQLIFTDSLSAFLASSSGMGYAVVGTNRFTTSEYFQGKIDDMMIYNRVLTVEEVGEIANDNLDGVAAIETRDFVQVYPTIATSAINVTLRNDIRAHLVLADAVGSVLNQFDITASCQVNMTSLSAGLYFIMITDDSGRRIIKKVEKV